MSVDLKTIVCKINVENGIFHSCRDRDIAREIWKRHSLQTLLESVSIVAKDSSNTNEKYLLILSILIENAPDDWMSIFVDGFNDPNTNSLCINSIRTLSKVAEVQPFAERNYFVYEQSDFPDVARWACVVQNILQTLLKKVAACRNSDSEIDGKWKCSIQVGYFLFSIVSQHAVTNLWTNTDSQAIADDCIQLLLETYGCSVSDFLVLDTKHTTPVDEESHYSKLVKKCVIGKLLLHWKPSLQRNTWQKNPTVASSFSWCLCQLKFPYLSDFVELLLPPCLLFVDDHVVENKEMGTLCLIHVLENASGEELRWYGRADVIYEALKLQMYSTEELLLKVTHEALLLTLKVIVKDVDKLAIATKYDEIFSLVLQAAFHENKLVLRRVHTRYLHVFIEALGINVVKYMPRLLELFEEYLEVSDAPMEEARLNILTALKSLIKVVWPRIPAHTGTILKVLVKLVHQITSSESDISKTVESELLVLSVDCLQLVKGLDKQCVEETLDKLKELPFSEKFHLLIQPLTIEK